MSRLSEVEVLVEVVRLGSFSDAARSLGVSKSFVSKRVSALEDRLGARLLHRTTRRLSLTDAGQAFYDRADRILADLEEAEIAVTALATAPRGKLRLSLPPSLGGTTLEDAMLQFMQLYPEVEVLADLSERPVDLVEDGFDLAVRIQPRLEDSSLVARRIAPVRQYVVASPDYLERHGRPTHPSELATHEALLYSRQSEVWALRGPAGEVTVRVRGRLVTNSDKALLTGAIRGLGVTRMPDFFLYEPVRAGLLEPLLPEWSEWGAVHVVYPHSRHLSPKVRAFVDFLADYVQERPWDLRPLLSASAADG